MEHGLRGLLARHDQAVRYLSQELRILAEESRQHQDSWTRVNERAEALLADVDTSLREARERDTPREDAPERDTPEREAGL